MPVHFYSALDTYRAIIVDEAQDMSVQAYQLISQMVHKKVQKSNIFVVGDAHQRIYRHKVVLGRCGIDIRGRGRKLRINYRTTEENRKWAVSLLEGIRFDDLDGGEDNQSGYKSLLRGIKPNVRQFESFQKEIEYIVKYLKQIKDSKELLSGTCIVVRTNSLMKQYEVAIKENKIKTYFVKRSEAEDTKAEGVRLATMHRVKGLEFDCIIIAGVNEGVVPSEKTGFRKSTDPVIKRETETHERALLYVAATRAKKNVLVTSFGKTSRFLTVYEKPRVKEIS